MSQTTRTEDETTGAEDRVPATGSISRRTAYVSAIAGALLGTLAIMPHLRDWWYGRSAAPSWTWDIDTALIHGGLLKAPGPADTLAWWYGTWVGQVPFYRPLTSYLFWLEWTVLGPREWLWSVPNMIAHIVATALFAFLACGLARRIGLPLPQVAATIAAWAFSGWLLDYRGSVVASTVMPWKNQPDTFAAVCDLAALIAYLGAQERRRALPRGALCWYLAACGFKEIAAPLPLLCALLEWRRPRAGVDRAARTRVLWMFAASAAFLSVRTLALRSIGYTYGGNAEWLRRTLQEFAGPFAPLVTHGEWLSAAVGLWLFGAGYLAARAAVRIGRERATAGNGRRGRAAVVGTTIGLAGASALGALQMWTQGGLARADALSPIGPIAGLLVCFEPLNAARATATAAFTGAIVVVGRRSPWAAGFAFAWTAAFLAPLVMSPGPIHRYYLVQAGYALLYGWAAAIVLQRVGRKPAGEERIVAA